jgi:4-amino-4-deoxy-L-arabinose transferase-like glycosyltransferase
VFAPLGWLVFIAVAGPWYLAIYIDDGAGFFQSFFLDHNLGRYGGVKHGHAGFPGYYFVMLPLVLLPFTGWFLRLLPMARALWADPLDRFLVLWFAGVRLLLVLGHQAAALHGLRHHAAVHPDGAAPGPALEPLAGVRAAAAASWLLLARCRWVGPLRRRRTAPTSRRCSPTGRGCWTGATCSPPGGLATLLGWR